MSPNNPNLSSIGQRLRRIREAEGLNQTQFAKKVGLTQAAISQFEDGKRMPSTKALQKIATSLERTIDSIMAEDEFEGESDKEKDAAIQALVNKLKNIDKKAIINLNRFIDDLGISDKDDKEL